MEVALDWLTEIVAVLTKYLVVKQAELCWSFAGQMFELCLVECLRLHTKWCLIAYWGLHQGRFCGCRGQRRQHCNHRYRFAFKLAGLVAASFSQEPALSQIKAQGWQIPLPRDQHHCHYNSYHIRFHQPLYKSRILTNLSPLT